MPQIRMEVNFEVQSNYPLYMEDSAPKEKLRDSDTHQESPFLSLALNIIIPSIILMKGSSPEKLGPVWGLVIALLFPIGYGIADLIRTRKVHWMSFLGLVSILLTGGIGLLELDPKWIALKEAAIPLVIGAVLLISAYMENPLIKKMFFRKEILNLQLIEAALARNSTQNQLNPLLKSTTKFLSMAFLLSAILNFSLAKWIVKSPAGTVAFNEELGRMTALSFPAIALPCLVVVILCFVYFVRGLGRLTGLGFQELLPQESQDEDAIPPESQDKA